VANRTIREGEIKMGFSISTPALLFSAITLLMLAYTNRFGAIAARVRQFSSIYMEKPTERLYSQIKNFRIRLKMIKNMQLLGAISFLFCLVSMLLIFVNKILMAQVVFAISLVALMISLAISIGEIFISVDALEIELDRVEEFHVKAK
jgi:hypothetical protein